jgi:hypothetical protein
VSQQMMQTSSYAAGECGTGCMRLGLARSANQAAQPSSRVHNCKHVPGMCPH